MDRFDKFTRKELITELNNQLGLKESWDRLSKNDLLLLVNAIEKKFSIVPEL